MPRRGPGLAGRGKRASKGTRNLKGGRGDSLREVGHAGHVRACARHPSIRAVRNPRLLCATRPEGSLSSLSISLFLSLFLTLSPSPSPSPSLSLSIARSPAPTHAPPSSIPPPPKPVPSLSSLSRPLSAPTVGLHPRPLT